MIFVDRSALIIPWDNDEKVWQDIKYIHDNRVFTDDMFFVENIDEIRQAIITRSRKNNSKYKKWLGKLFNYKCG